MASGCILIEMLLASILVTNAHSDDGGHRPARQLLSYNDTTKHIELHADAITQLATLKSPIRIMSAIGDARVSKSSTMNIVRHLWKGDDWEKFERVFTISNQMKACTKGVWISIAESDDGSSVVFLDVEGSNLGDDAQTNQFSIFATLISSGLMLFGEETIANHNRDFLYRVARLTDEIWRDNVNSAAVTQFPELNVVLRQPLDPPKGSTLLEYTVKAIHGVGNDKSKIMEKFFPREKMKASGIPYLPYASTHPKWELQALDDTEYRESISSLVAKSKLMQPKRTINGALMNGEMTKDLARSLVDALNKNSWALFSDTYTALEKSLCEKGFNCLIRPLEKSDHHSLITNMDGILKQFATTCVLESEKQIAENWLKDLINVKVQAEEKERLIEEERKQKEKEKKKQMEIEEQRRQEEEIQKHKMEEEKQRKIVAERKQREDAERIRQEEEKQRRQQEELEELTREAKEIKRKQNEDNIIGALALGGGLLWFFSDEGLKQNITTLPGSKYELIGLHGVHWFWNKHAEDTLGLNGSSEGVIAQEVEEIYPEAVKVGARGFKCVSYSYLDKIVGEKLKHAL